MNDARERQPRFASGVGALVLALAAGSSSVAAHPGPALPPEFGETQCISVIDLREQTSAELAYTVAFNDDVFDVGDIVLPDAKTHQFFAFRGALTAAGAGYALWPFAGDVDEAIAMPLWINQDDIDRAADAVTTKDGTGFAAQDVVPEDVLSARDDLADHVLRITGEDARVPITYEQSQLGVTWSLDGLAPGVYGVAGYVFSPPYNDWSPRAGVFKVIDGEHDPPAATVDAVDAFVYGGQGRKVGGCVDAPEGSRLDAWYRVEGETSQPWERWATDVALQNDRFKLCFERPETAPAGVVRVRVDITTPDGQVTRAYSPDTVVFVDTPAPCRESEETCCSEAPAVVEPPQSSDAGTSAPAGARGAAGGSGDAGTPTADPAPMADDPSGDDAPPTDPMKARSSSCSTTPHNTARAPALALASALALMLCWRRRLRCA